MVCELDLDAPTPEEQRALEIREEKRDRAIRKYEEEMDDYYNSHEYKEYVRRVEAFDDAQREIREKKIAMGEKPDPEDYWRLGD